MKLVIAIALFLSGLAAQPANTDGRFQSGTISGVYGIVTPPNFGGLQGPTNIFVCAKSTDSDNLGFMATILFESEGVQEVTIKLKPTMSAIGSCGIALTPSMRKLIGISVLPYSPAREVFVDVR